jgi:predicted TIM-barrel fold metal-dependent hydrolase
MTDLGFVVPDGATDCHMHIFGDPAAYPPAAWRAYDPTPATLPVYNAEAARMGFSRVVFVQPSAYGTDNTCMKDALKARGASSRGIAVIDAATKDTELKALAKLGVRGVRLNLVSNGIPDVGAAVAQLQETAARVGKLGWHIQIFALPSLLASLAPAIADLGVDIVIDHMGAGDGKLAASRPGFDDVLALLRAGKAWVKVSGANRVSRAGGAFEDAVPVIRALVEANPERAVWGTDWPHIGPHKAGAPERVVYMPYDNRALLRLLGLAVSDAAVIRQVLVDNPAKLYGF